LLKDHNFDIYVPEDYDESEPYGLVVFINSGNNGGFKSQWLPVLDNKNLIWIAGDGTGNSVFINIRMGLAMAGVLRMLELYNIDPNRIYTSGNSGGARMAHNLAFIYPETFRGAMPSCGGSYIREVSQDYETQNPDGHYEAILDYPVDYLDYLLPFDQRFANMTSYDDFREGDIMNIYHNGSEEDGVKGKFLETAGGHCSTTTAHFLDAINFVEHPFNEVIIEIFDGNTNLPFRLLNADLANSQKLQLGHNIEDIAQIQSRDLFNWHDPKGAIFETSIQLNPNDYNMNTTFHLGFWSMQEPEAYCGFLGNELKEDMPSIFLTIDFTDEQPKLTVQVENPAQTDIQVLFTSTFSDWNINESLNIKYHLWDQELRVELGAHIASPTMIESGVRLLDDMRSIQIRWNEITSSFWEESAWSQGAFLTLVSEKKNVEQAASSLLIDKIELINADTEVQSEIPISHGMFFGSFCEGDTLNVEGEIITEEGIYQIALLNSKGCDSLLLLSVTFYPLPTVNISVLDGIISADEGFEIYQWYLNGALLEGETGSTLAVTFDGEYYVLVTNENSCENSSNTIDVMITSTFALESNRISIYPNPSTQNLVIDSKGIIFKADLFDLVGNRVMINLKDVNDISILDNGMYILVMQLENDILIKKVQKVD